MNGDIQQWQQQLGDLWRLTKAHPSQAAFFSGLAALIAGICRVTFTRSRIVESHKEGSRLLGVVGILGIVGLGYFAWQSISVGPESEALPQHTKDPISAFPTTTVQTTTTTLPPEVAGVELQPPVEDPCPALSVQVAAVEVGDLVALTERINGVNAVAEQVGIDASEQAEYGESAETECVASSKQYWLIHLGPFTTPEIAADACNRFGRFIKNNPAAYPFTTSNRESGAQDVDYPFYRDSDGRLHQENQQLYYCGK